MTESAPRHFDDDRATQQAQRALGPAGPLRGVGPARAAGAARQITPTGQPNTPPARPGAQVMPNVGAAPPPPAGNPTQSQLPTQSRRDGRNIEYRNLANLARQGLRPGRTYMADFIKRTDGSRRRMRFSVPIPASFRGETRRQWDPRSYNLLNVLDRDKGAPRMINLDGLLRLRGDGVEYRRWRGSSNDLPRDIRTYAKDADMRHYPKGYGPYDAGRPPMTPYRDSGRVREWLDKGGGQYAIGQQPVRLSETPAAPQLFANRRRREDDVTSEVADATGVESDPRTMSIGGFETTVDPMRDRFKFSPMQGQGKLDGWPGHILNQPSGHSCPGAGTCRTKVVRNSDTDRPEVRDMQRNPDGTPCGPGEAHRCYSATAEAYSPEARRARWHNMGLVAQLGRVARENSWDAASTIAGRLDESLPETPMVRLHESGDIMSPAYLGALTELARRRPQTNFHTYTKSLQILDRYLQGGGEIPSNMVINASKGAYGRDADRIIDALGLPYSQIVRSPEEAAGEGLPIDWDDTQAILGPDLARDGQRGFGLLLHGTQPKGSGNAEQVRKNARIVKANKPSPITRATVAGLLQAYNAAPPEERPMLKNILQRTAKIGRHYSPKFAEAAGAAVHFCASCGGTCKGHAQRAQFANDAEYQSTGRNMPPREPLRGPSQPITKSPDEYNAYVDEPSWSSQLPVGGPRSEPSPKVMDGRTGKPLGGADMGLLRRFLKTREDARQRDAVVGVNNMTVNDPSPLLPSPAATASYPDPLALAGIRRAERRPRYRGHSQQINFANDAEDPSQYESSELTLGELIERRKQQGRPMPRPQLPAAPKMFPRAKLGEFEPPPEEDLERKGVNIRAFRRAQFANDAESYGPGSMAGGNFKKNSPGYTTDDAPTPAGRRARLLGGPDPFVEDPQGVTANPWGRPQGPSRRGEIGETFIGPNPTVIPRQALRSARTAHQYVGANAAPGIHEKLAEHTRGTQVEARRGGEEYNATFRPNPWATTAGVTSPGIQGYRSSWNQGENRNPGLLAVHGGQTEREYRSDVAPYGRIKESGIPSRREAFDPIDPEHLPSRDFGLGMGMLMDGFKEHRRFAPTWRPNDGSVSDGDARSVDDHVLQDALARMEIRDPSRRSDGSRVMNGEDLRNMLSTLAISNTADELAALDDYEVDSGLMGSFSTARGHAGTLADYLPDLMAMQRDKSRRNDLGDYYDRGDYYEDIRDVVEDTYNDLATDVMQAAERYGEYDEPNIDDWQIDDYVANDPDLQSERAELEAAESEFAELDPDDPDYDDQYDDLRSQIDFLRDEVERLERSTRDRAYEDLAEDAFNQLREDAEGEYNNLNEVIGSDSESHQGLLNARGERGYSEREVSDAKGIARLAKMDPLARAGIRRPRSPLRRAQRQFSAALERAVHFSMSAPSSYMDYEDEERRRHDFSAENERARREQRAREAAALNDDPERWLDFYSPSRDPEIQARMDRLNRATLPQMSPEEDEADARDFDRSRRLLNVTGPAEQPPPTPPIPPSATSLRQLDRLDRRVARQPRARLTEQSDTQAIRSQVSPREQRQRLTPPPGIGGRPMDDSVVEREWSALMDLDAQAAEEYEREATPEPTGALAAPRGAMRPAARPQMQQLARPQMQQLARRGLGGTTNLYDRGDPRAAMALRNARTTPNLSAARRPLGLSKTGDALRAPARDGGALTQTQVPSWADMPTRPDSYTQVDLDPSTSETRRMMRPPATFNPRAYAPRGGGDIDYSRLDSLSDDAAAPSLSATHDSPRRPADDMRDAARPPSLGGVPIGSFIPGRRQRFAPRPNREPNPAPKKVGSFGMRGADPRTIKGVRPQREAINAAPMPLHRAPRLHDPQRAAQPTSAPQSTGASQSTGGSPPSGRGGKAGLMLPGQQYGMSARRPGMKRLLGLAGHGVNRQGTRRTLSHRQNSPMDRLRGKGRNDYSSKPYATGGDRQVDPELTPRKNTITRQFANEESERTGPNRLVQELRERALMERQLGMI